MKHYFFSSLTIDECAERLTQYINGHPLHFYSRYPLTLVGEIDGYRFTLRTSSRSNPNLFCGTLCPWQLGTLVEGDYHMHWAPKLVGWGILGCGVISSCVLGSAILVSAIGMLVVPDIPVRLGEDLSLILGLLLAGGLLLPLGGIVLALILVLASGVSRRIWQSTDLAQITAFMEDRLEAPRVDWPK